MSAQQVVHFNWDSQGLCRAAVDTMVLALKEDPVNAYFCGSRGTDFARDEVKGYVKALPGAAHFVCTPDANAAALWQLLPEETPKNELWAGWTRVLKVPLRLWRQLLDLELHYEAAHEAVAAARGSYYYLSFIGTRPEARGKGQGSLLLSYITAKADAEGRVCLLEATSARSRSLYERHGFICYETYNVRPQAPPVFFMMREPKAAAAVAAAVAARVSQDGGGQQPHRMLAVHSAFAELAAKPQAAAEAGRADERPSFERPAGDAIPAVRSIEQLAASEAAPHHASSAAVAALSAGMVPLHLRGERPGSDDSDDAVVMSHSSCPTPSAALVHAMSLKQAAATALALAAAAHSADGGALLLPSGEAAHEGGPSA